MDPLVFLLRTIMIMVKSCKQKVLNKTEHSPLTSPFIHFHSSLNGRGSQTISTQVNFFFSEGTGLQDYLSLQLVKTSLSATQYNVESIKFRG